MVLKEHLEISNDTGRLAEVREWVRKGARAGGFPEKLLSKVILAVDEAVTNIIEHAFPDVPRGGGAISLLQEVDETRYRIEIVDDGMLRFDPTEIRTVDIHAHVQSGRNGGLGIFLMRRIMDVVDYSYESGRCNKLTLIKYVKPPQERP